MNLGPKLEEIWDRQKTYNEAVKARQPRPSGEWMYTYILGAMSELGELLRETNWKKHRITLIDEFGPNIQEELADLTKYIFSMWQLMGFHPEDMLRSIEVKSEILEQIFKQEMREPLKGKHILMLDLDGVIADFRSGFLKWLEYSEWKDLVWAEDPGIGMHMDVNHGWVYSSYDSAKVRFEKEGGYKKLPSIKEMMKAVNYMKYQGWYIIVYTARPYSAYRRIWSDTWLWLLNHNLVVDELHFGHDNRITRAVELAKDNMVIAFEDNPDLAMRYATSGIVTVVPAQPYNTELKPSNHLVLLSEDISDMEIVDVTYRIVKNGNQVQER